ncbi:unnamed protein product [Moneuplotes crassus]|uniref:Dynein light intermediate chain n=1 Tax=Euplotes crassus TaxID=5936 RepID=A0AAD1USH6_EUPCR|nr:unnamed protein product [Moneuplotes crassus]
MEDNKEQKLENLWSDCFSTEAMQNLTKESHLVLFGDNSSGKKSIIDYISKNIIKIKKKGQDDEGPRLFSSFDYDHLGNTNVWYLNDPEMKDFLIDNFKPGFLEDTIFAIVLDSSKPWQFLDQLSIWSDVIFEINKKLFLQLPVAKQNKMKKDIENQFKFYTQKRKKLQKARALDLMDLEEGILNVNLGVPLLVICTKSEVIATGEAMKYFSPRFEFILKNLREFTLRYGATLIFTSSKKGTNMNVLNDYMRFIYSEEDFEHPPEINDKEGIFIPCGFDSPKLIQQLCPSINDPYDKIVSNLIGSGEIDHQEVICESWEECLEELSKNESLCEDVPDNIFGDPSKSGDDSKASTKVNAKSFFEKLKGNTSKIRTSTAGRTSDETEEEKKKKMEDFKKKLQIDTD